MNISLEFCIRKTALIDFTSNEQLYEPKKMRNKRVTLAQ